MKLNPQPVASDVAAGIRQQLSGIQGVSGVNVSASGTTITVKAKIPPTAKGAVTSLLEGYSDSGFGIVLDRRSQA